MDIRLLQQEVQKIFADTEFLVSEIYNTRGHPKNDFFQIEYKSWRNNEKFEFHYEVQQDSKEENKIFIRIDCHFRPYQPFVEGRHGDNEHRQLTYLLKVLSEIPSNTKKRTYFRKDAVWGVKWNLAPTLPECVEEIHNIVLDTWQMVDELVSLS